jgi:hypothetical protein
VIDRFFIRNDHPFSFHITTPSTSIRSVSEAWFSAPTTVVCTSAWMCASVWSSHFLAELLNPFKAVEAAFKDDYSDEAQQEVAESFDVSPLTIRTLLVNHGRISRDELEVSSEAAVV